MPSIDTITLRVMARRLRSALNDLETANDILDPLHTGANEDATFSISQAHVSVVRTCETLEAFDE